MLPADSRLPIERIIDVEGQQLVESSRLTRPFSETTRMVCGPCNNGWMARLENETKSLFDMMEGTGPFVLEKRMQQTLAAWALKTAIVLDHAQGRPWQPTAMADEREHVARTGVPSEHVLVWLASCFDAPPAQARLWGTRAAITMTDGEHGDGHVFGATLSLGHICLQVLYSTIPGMADAHAIEERPAITLIWPFRDAFDWRSRNEFDNSGVQEFAAVMPKVLRSVLKA
jgi:hypothetical protein